MAQSLSKSIPAPKGTRDLYPDDLLRQRYITEAWRRVSIRHGFDEIAGPTFEMLDLYKKKSGEGIVSELFSFRRTGGDDDYALRPEFTPTLARMYAAKANALPSPCKWFTAGPYFRAEKPQRGRLREFLQWNCDVIGGDQSDLGRLDADLVEVVIRCMNELGIQLAGFAAPGISVRLNDRKLINGMLRSAGVADHLMSKVMQLIDEIHKLDREGWDKRAQELGVPSLQWLFDLGFGSGSTPQLGFLDRLMREYAPGLSPEDVTLGQFLREIEQRGYDTGIRIDLGTVRGLAYYTGTVFELIADGERAVAGGGRYDNLIELFGGPPTPAVGFGMGDVVLGLLLEDKGLMPEGPDLMDALSQKPASLRPEAFVIANEAGESQVEPLLAKLRRGVESEAWNSREGKKPWDADRYCSKSGGVSPMHARRSYKSTKNIGKLLADARKQHAKFAVIIDSDHAAKVENLDTRQDLGTFPLDQVGAKIAEHL